MEERKERSSLFIFVLNKDRLQESGKQEGGRAFQSKGQRLSKGLTREWREGFGTEEGKIMLVYLCFE